MRKTNIHKVTLSAVFLAVGMILPLFTAQIKEIGDTLLPMHIPVMLCGLLCGPWHGLTVGLLLPFLRSALFAMPPLYPNAVWMACELATYGVTIGLAYTRLKAFSMARLYACLAFSMVCGRVVWGIVKAVLLGLGGEPFTMQAFIAGGLLDAIPGILLQLVLIPLIVGIVRKQNREP